ncbi:hypothetical protein A6M21_15365 [Desulfotomaculum copahuensis]|uniref:Uncharacterized protein n=1 Tax=Desulfotomaculum copahuensis TaxID=1838280 RepID=A0A1B7LBJ4_9FIRM|nr:hypothetical protein A6M21_15365 [Desulfotomaculum copahuensis]
MPPAGGDAVHSKNGGRARKVIIAVVAVLVVVAAGLAITHGKKPAAVDQAAAGTLTVSTAKAETGYLSNDTVVSGKLEAVQSSEVVAKMPGKVAAVFVDVGSTVQAGQPLVQLDNKDLQDRVSQAQSGVSQAQAAVDQAQAGVQAAQAGAGTAQAALATARANYAVAQANYQRGQQLLAAGAIPQADFERLYELPYEKAKQDVENSAPSGVASNQAQQAQAQAGLKTAQAGLQAAQAALALAQQALHDSVITAPFSGVITARLVDPGEMANGAVVSMVNLDKVVVKATVGEDVINQLKQGEKVQVKISAASGQPFTGVLTNISPAADPVTKAYPVKIEIDNANHILKPGMFAEVDLPRDRQKSLLVPRDAVVKDGDKSYVWVLKDGVVNRREVKTGDSDGTNIVITSGLTAGEDVVTAGQETLQDGARVTVKNG